MEFTTDDVVGFLDDSSYINSTDDDLGIELEELDSVYFHGGSNHGNKIK